MLKSGDIKVFNKIVLPEDIAAFPDQLVHEVYATFALARDVEWSSRLFLIEIIEEDEEGIGIELQVKHISPALVGEKVAIEATITSFIENKLYCDITAKVGNRIIAIGKTGQKIIKKDKFKKILSGLTTENK
jgi:predicted thioesterase